jgi:hypothetical protein
MLPLTARVDLGLLVPIPTNPVDLSYNNPPLATLNPPANVLVALAPVAVKLSAVGEVVATTLPLASVERRAEASEVKVREPNDAFCAKRFVDEAVVEKKLVEVAFARVVLPLNEFELVKVFAEYVFGMVVDA